MKLKKFAKEVYQIWVTERPVQLAAALAYYSMFSFAPVIFVAFSIVGFFLEDIDLMSQFFQRLEIAFGAEISSLVRDSVMALSKTPANSSILVSIVSFLVLVYAASGVFYQLQFTLNKIWQVPPPVKGTTISTLRRRVLAFAVVIGIGLLAIFAMLTNLLLAWFGSSLEKLLGIDASLSIITGISVFALVALTFALFYKFLPETKVAWRDVWLGAVISTILVMTAVILVVLFFRLSSFSSALQAAGAFTVLLSGFYYIAQIFLLGAVSCRVYASHFGSRRLEVEPR